MKNYTFEEAKKILSDFYPQMISFDLVNDKKCFTFTVIVQGQLFFSGEYFKTVGLNLGGKSILLEITQEKLNELETEFNK